jgi:hypothetical protein
VQRSLFPRRLLLVAALGLVPGACTESPAEPLATGPSFDHAGNHPAQTGPAIAVSIIEEPTVDANPSIDACRVHYGFEVAAKKPATVRWEAYYIGGGDDGVQFGRSNSLDVGGRAGTVVVAPTAGHPNDGHTFDYILIQIREPLPSGALIAEAQTAGGATISC